MNKNKPKLIGRTRINIDNYDVDLTNINYSKINKLSQDFMLKNRIAVLPVDVVTIAKNNNWIIIPYSKLTEPILSLYEEILHTDWGFTIYYHGRYMIFYNDAIKLGSQRFTIAHEIGHIVLEHFISSDAELREIESNYFAANILMPIGILRNCKVETGDEISTLCGVGYMSAMYRLQKMQDSTIEYENIDIEKQFSNFTKMYLGKKYH